MSKQEKAFEEIEFVFAVSVVPLYLLGLAGWLCRHYPRIPNKVAGYVSKATRYLRRGLPLPSAVKLKLIDVTILEVLGLVLLIIVPKIVGWVLYINLRVEKRRRELESNGGISDISDAQYWLKSIALGFGKDFLRAAPWLMALVGRGTLLNVFLGVKYATLIKYHRWVGAFSLVDVIIHGILYHAYWFSRSFEYWLETIKHGAGLGGCISWVAAIFMTVFLWDFMRRKRYYLFYMTHVLGGFIFLIFAIVHMVPSWIYLAPGLTVWGFDLAYQALQRELKVPASATVGDSIITLRIPFEGKYEDGSHVWLAVKNVKFNDFHPFTVASRSDAPGWGNTLLLHCKIASNWTKGLAALVRKQGSGESITAQVLGPHEGRTLSENDMEMLKDCLVVTGGSGIAAVLASLDRLACFRKYGVWSGKGNKVVVIHSARSIDDLMLIAPLLHHPEVFELRLFYTGIATHVDSKHTYKLPAPLVPKIEKNRASSWPWSPLAQLESINPNSTAPLVRDSAQGESEALVMNGQAVVPTPGSTGLHNSETLDVRPSWTSQEGWRHVKSVYKKWEHIYVWTAAFAMSYWVMGFGVSLSTDKHMRDTRGWNVLGMFLLVPILPLIILLVYQSSIGLVIKHCDIKYSREETSQQLPQSPDECCLLVDSVANQWSLSIPGTELAPVAVAWGRPGIKAAVRKAAVESSGQLSVWSAGPRPMHEAVYEAVNELPFGKDIQLQKFAHEL